MKASLFYAIVILASASSPILGEQSSSIQQMETSGDTLGARTALARAAQASPNNVAALTAYAEFLDRYGDPGAREAYGKLLDRTPQWRRFRACRRRRPPPGDARSAGRRPRRRRHPPRGLPYAPGGKAVTLGKPPAPKSPADAGTALIPGPLRSFARMAALSPDSDPSDVLPALARNVVTNGYQASHNNESLEQTEYLKLVHRYLSQARELEKLAGETPLHQDR